MKNRRFF